MKSYFLLRNNRESGPFTLKELKGLDLFTTDLFWVHGESTCWSSPAEMEELKEMAVRPAAQKKKPATTFSASTSTAGRQATACTQPQPKIPAAAVAAPEMTEERPSFEKLKEKYGARKKNRTWSAQAPVAANFLGATTLLIGVAMGAFMIKKAVDSIDFGPDPSPLVATAQSKEIGAGGVYVHSASQSALASAVPAAPAGTVEGGETEPEPLPETKETAPAPIIVKTPEPRELKPPPGPASEQKAPAEKTSNAAAKETGGDAEEDSDTAVKEAEEKKEAAAKEPRAPSLQVSANAYKVGLLGGISNLELSVSNPGSQAINRATVEVQYLKPNGKVLHSQTFEVSGIAPQSSKKINVPDNNRGVSVRYRVVNVEV